MRQLHRLTAALIALACAVFAHARAPDPADLACAQPAAVERGARRSALVQLLGDARAMNRDEQARARLSPEPAAEPAGWTVLLAGVLVIAAIAHRRSSWRAD